jgi:hypothetical protein
MLTFIILGLRANTPSVRHHLMTLLLMAAIFSGGGTMNISPSREGFASEYRKAYPKGKVQGCL